MRYRAVVVAFVAGFLGLVSLPAFAVYTGITVPGVKPQDFQSGTVTLPGGESVPIVTREDCEKNKKNDEKCNEAALFFIRTDKAIANGSQVGVKVQGKNGAVHTFNGTVSGGLIQMSSAGTPSNSSYGYTPGGSGLARPDSGMWQLRAGYNNMKAPDLSGALGITLSTTIGNETVTSYAPRDYSGQTAGFSYAPNRSFDVMGRTFRPYMSLNWSKGDEVATGRTPSGPNGNGFTYPVNAGTSPGLNFGTSPADVRIAGDYENFGLRFGGMRFPGEEQRFFCSLGGQWERTTLDFDGDLTVPAFTGASEVSVDNRQKLRTDTYTFPYTLGLIHPLNERVSFTPLLTLAPGYHRTRLSGQWHSICVPCGATSPQRDFTSDYDDSESGFFYSASAGFGLDMSINERFDLGLWGEYKFLSEVGRAANRETPNDDPTHVESDSATRWQTGLSIQFKF